MKNQALFSSKDKSKNLKCRLLQFLFCALRVKLNALFQGKELYHFSFYLPFQWSWVRYPVWRHTFISPSAFSRRAVVSYWQKYVHEVLVNRLGGLSLPRKSVVRLTDRPDMTLDVYRGCKTTIQQQQPFSVGVGGGWGGEGQLTKERVCFPICCGPSLDLTCSGGAKTCICYGRNKKKKYPRNMKAFPYLQH